MHTFHSICSVTAFLWRFRLNLSMFIASTKGRESDNFRVFRICCHLRKFRNWNFTVRGLAWLKSGEGRNKNADLRGTKQRIWIFWGTIIQLEVDLRWCVTVISTVIHLSKFWNGVGYLIVMAISSDGSSTGHTRHWPRARLIWGLTTYKKICVIICN